MADKNIVQLDGLFKWFDPTKIKIYRKVLIVLLLNKHLSKYKRFLKLLQVFKL